MLQTNHEAHHFLHSLCINPKITFDSQKPSEHVHLVLRQHPVTQIYWMLNTIFLFILFLFAQYFLSQFFTTNQLIVFAAFSLTYIFAYAWINMLLWLFNVGIVTNMRIVDIDLVNIIYKEVTATHVNQVSDVTSKIGGFFGSLFQYGDIEVKTEGFQQNIEFVKVPHPIDVVHIINDLIPNGKSR